MQRGDFEDKDFAADSSAMSSLRVHEDENE